MRDKLLKSGMTKEQQMQFGQLRHSLLRGSAHHVVTYL